MPALTLLLRWPDGTLERIYSPSTVVRDFLQPGREYPVAEFCATAGRAFHAASERVRAVYGMPCSRAAASLAAIERHASGFSDGCVTLERFEQETG
jgi:uncharacterized repeat protein (TIGR04042 family)